MSKVCKLLLVDLGSSRTELNEPIGIAALAGYAKAVLGERCHITLRFTQLDGGPTDEELSRADIVGLSTRLGSLPRTQAMVERVRMLPAEQRPLVVCGDLIATFATDALLIRLPEVICVVGEGEDSLVEIVRAWLEAHGAVRRQMLAREVPNLALIQDGLTRRTARRLVDLARASAPNHSFVPAIAERGGIIRAEASRGCAWGLCNFCAIQYKYCDSISWRPIPSERIVAELAELSELGVRSPFYTDEDFIGSDPSRALELAEAITAARQRGEIAPELSLYVNARVDTIMAPARDGVPSGAEVFAALKRAGLREVFVGVESGARDQVRRYRKAATAQRNLAAIALLNGLGISLDVGFIMFDPKMRFEELQANLDFIEEAGLDTHDARLTKSLRVEPGTPMVEEYEREGLLAGPLDVNELIYPYRWLDPRAEAVHAAFSAWERQRMEEIYAIQARTRGELENERLRHERRVELGRIRRVELNALASLVDATQAGQEPARVALELQTRARDERIRAAQREDHRADP